MGKGIYFAIPGFMYAWLNNLSYLVLLSYEIKNFSCDFKI